MRIGFIGLGIMGTPMALHLVNAGHELFVHTAGKLPEAIAASSATPCANAEEVARQAEVVFTMVPDTPDVESVLFGAHGVAAGRGLHALETGLTVQRRLEALLHAQLADVVRAAVQVEPPAVGVLVDRQLRPVGARRRGWCRRHRGSFRW